MPRDCDCAGGTCRPSELSRRDFMRIWGAGIAGVSLKPAQTEAERFSMRPDELARWRGDLLKLGKPRVYLSNKHTDARLHLGGIGAGNVEIGADGQLTTWQLFNTLRDGMVPMYFAVKAGNEARLLQTTGGPDWPRIKRIRMRGEYPFAFLSYEDPALPIALELEAFTPFAPLETEISSLPVAVFVFRVRNTSKSPQQVSLAAFMQNPVGYEALGTPEGNRHAQYGGNRNSVRMEGKATVLRMTAALGALPSLNRTVTLCTNYDPPALSVPFNDRPSELKVASLNDLTARGSRVDLIWLEDLAADTPASTLRAVLEAVHKGATVVFSGTEQPLLRAYGAATQGQALDSVVPRPTVLFEDFEQGYENWAIEGDAFGQRPASGTLPNQQRVSGYLGKGLVNSYLNGDGTTGRMVSRPFVIQHRFIRFLIGGGSSPQTQLRLVVDGRVVRAASGRNDERLLPAFWDVTEFEGKEAQLHIVDEATGGWGHINVDQIEFSDLPWDAEAIQVLTELLPMRFAEVRAGDPDPVTGLRRVEFAALSLVPGAKSETLPNGVPALTRALGAGKVVVVQASILPASQTGIVRSRQRAYQLLCGLVGAEYAPPAGLHPLAPGAGELELAALMPASTALRDFTDWQVAWSRFVSQGSFRRGVQSASPGSPEGETVNGAVASTVTVQPGQTVDVPFVLTWRYPNKYTRQGVPIGNYYSERWRTVAAVTRHVCTNLSRLRALTELFRKTFYDSTLPYWFLDCLTANAAIIRHVGVVFRLANGDVFGWEGSNGCCQPTCTHVWGYEQTLSRLFPDLERKMRRIDFKHQQRQDGGVNNRTEVPSPPRPTGEFPFADGHASCILKAFREALNNPDASWLQEYWPHVRRAVDYLIHRDAAAHGGEPNGTLEDDQWNTYDEALHGVTTFISGYYLAALRAGEEWARRVGDATTAARYRAVFEKGRARLVELCWDGEYFRQHLPAYETMPGEVGPGCMADQLIGQWWAHQLGLGYILPPEKVKSALAAVFKYNWMTDLTGWKHMPRAFAGDGDKGLMIVTWPKGGRPPHVMLYSDEVWTGIEYQVAAHLIYEGMAREGLEIVRGARDRYDGIPRPPIPRNPWNEIECGGHYARALSSWSLLLAATGWHYDAPARALRIAPRVTPERIRAFFCGPEGWGTLSQVRSADRQVNEVTVAHGNLAVDTLCLEAPQRFTRVSVSVASRRIECSVEGTNAGPRITFRRTVALRAGERMRVVLSA